MTVVVDAGVVVAALTDAGPDGAWARQVLVSGPLAAPHLMPVEVANVLRRGSLGRTISDETATHAVAELGSLAIELVPFEVAASRVWELRRNLTCYDGWYVAVAEELDAPLATLDDRLTRAPGVRCAFLTSG